MTVCFTASTRPRENSRRTRKSSRRPLQPGPRRVRFRKEARAPKAVEFSKPGLWSGIVKKILACCLLQLLLTCAREGEKAGAAPAFLLDSVALGGRNAYI